MVLIFSGSRKSDVVTVEGSFGVCVADVLPTKIGDTAALLGDAEGAVDEDELSNANEAVRA